MIIRNKENMQRQRSLFLQEDFGLIEKYPIVESDLPKEKKNDSFTRKESSHLLPVILVLILEMQAKETTLHFISYQNLSN